MILSHELKVIFIKTKKVGGTSFEIAMSRACGPLDVITPISDVDEAKRQELGYLGPQNFEKPHRWYHLTKKSRRLFYNHIPSVAVKALVPAEIWQSYRKITIVRNPYDTIISRYFWSGKRQTGKDFGSFVRRYPKYLTENRVIAPFEGEARLDHYLRYEHLQADLDAIGLGWIGEEMRSIRAKGAHRPKDGASVADIYRQFPEVVDLIRETCAEEIARFGYAPPSLAT